MSDEFEDECEETNEYNTVSVDFTPLVLVLLFLACCDFNGRDRDMYDAVFDKLEYRGVKCDTNRSK